MMEKCHFIDIHEFLMKRQRYFFVWADGDFLDKSRNAGMQEEDLSSTSSLIPRMSNYVFIIPWTDTKCQKLVPVTVIVRQQLEGD